MNDPLEFGTGSDQYRPRVLIVGIHLGPDVGSVSVGQGLAARLRDRGFVLHLTSQRHSRVLRVIDMLVTVWFTRSRYDVALVDVFSGAAFRWAEWVTRLLGAIGKPFALTLRGGNLPEFTRRQPHRVKRLLANATAVTSPSNYLAEAMRSLRRDINVIPNSLAVETYSYRLRDRPKARLVWLRTFHKIYDPVLAVRVLARVASHETDAHLTMIGPDKDGSLAEVREEAKRLGVLDRILFTGGIPKSAVPGHLASGDIFLNTTTIDNTPVSVLEAMASGLVVVSTEVGGIPYVIENDHDGMLVPAGDADAMADAVRRLLTEQGLAARLSHNARAKAEMFSWNNVLPLWETLIVSVARQGGSRSA